MASRSLNYAQGVQDSNVFPRMLHANDREFRSILKQLQEDQNRKAVVVSTFSVSHHPYTPALIEPFRAQFPKECAVLNEISEERFSEIVDLYQTHFDELNYNHDETCRQFGLSPADVDIFARVIETLYKSNIHRLDRLFGDVLERIRQTGLYEDAIVLFTADHGETLYVREAPFKWSHSFTLRSDVLDVPLIIHAPGAEGQSTHCNAVSRSIDLFPTLVGIAGLKTPEDWTPDGYDFSSVIRGQKQPPSLRTFSHSYMTPWKTDSSGFRAKLYPRTGMDLTWVGVRDGDLVVKYRNNDGNGFQFVAFDQVNDPRELSDIFDRENPHHRQLVDELLSYKADLVDAQQLWEELHNSTEERQSSDSLQRLRSLGYVK